MRSVATLSLLLVLLLIGHCQKSSAQAVAESPNGKWELVRPRSDSDKCWLQRVSQKFQVKKLPLAGDFTWVSGIDTAWSHDSSRFLLSRDTSVSPEHASFELAVVTIKGLREVKITGQGDVRGATLSPTARFVAVRSSRPGDRFERLTIWDLAGGKPSPRMFALPNDAAGICWTGHDTAFVFSAISYPSGGPEEFYTINADSGRVAPVPKKFYDNIVRLSPYANDPEHVLAVVGPIDHASLVFINAKTGHRRVLITLPEPPPGFDRDGWRLLWYSKLRALAYERTAIGVALTMDIDCLRGRVGPMQRRAIRGIPGVDSRGRLVMWQGTSVGVAATVR
jgi:hypothetical protein